ncbi:MAG TPA: hypothetical protein VK968_07290, partial [Roseimicrobium sp.]|nr:hypothetical protein [Roseimicrobium sp.]
MRRIHQTYNTPSGSVHSAVRRASAAVFEQLEGRTLLSAVPVTGGVPALNSNPGASVKLFLDFDGAPAQTWNNFSAAATPAYDRDGDPTTFNNTGDSNLHTELDNIQQIWSRVAEKFSPFNVNVTTVDPGSYGDKQVLRVVVGGAGMWRSTNGWSGAVLEGSFYNSYANTAYVFAENMNGSVNYVADYIAHYAARGFGAYEQSTYNSNGVKTVAFNNGNSSIAPLLGSATAASRGLWWNGTSGLAQYDVTTQKNVPIMQDD